MLPSDALDQWFNALIDSNADKNPRMQHPFVAFRERRSSQRPMEEKVLAAIEKLTAVKSVDHFMISAYDF